MTHDRTPAEDVALCAHDLRGALTVISGYIDLLQLPDLTEADRARALAGVEAALRRAEALLDELSGLSGPTSPRETVDLTALAARAADDARVASGRTIAVLTEGSVFVPADAIALARALQNLLENAVRYAPEGTIEIAVTTSGDRAVVEVADHGPGIPVDDRERVFLPRVRLERNAHAAGSGLGLAVVKSVVSGHDGRVEVLDREGGGIIMRLELPLGPPVD